MPEFAYIARDHAGQRTSGTVSAASRREALGVLAGRDLFPIEVRDAAAAEAALRSARVPAARMAVTYGQLSDLLRSGVPLLRALEVIEKQASHAGLKAILSDVRRAVEDGATLADAMARYQSRFGEMAVSMVRAGGEGGFLEEALGHVAEFTDAQDDLKKRALGATIYPAVLAAFGLAVVTGIMIFLVPQFADLFATLRKAGELPWLTEGLLAVSTLVRGWGIVVALAALAGGWALRNWLRGDAGRWWSDRTRLRLPLVGPVFLGLAVARFCRVLGTLLRNGVPILRAMEISREATGNRVLATAIREATENISAGQPLAGPLAASGQFPPAVVEMIAVAEQANNLESVLLGIADSLERRTMRRLDLAVRLIEPVMLIFIAGLILLVVLAMLLPVLKTGGTV